MKTKGYFAVRKYVCIEADAGLDAARSLMAAFCDDGLGLETDYLDENENSVQIRLVGYCPLADAAEALAELAEAFPETVFDAVLGDVQASVCDSGEGMSVDAHALRELEFGDSDDEF